MKNDEQARRADDQQWAIDRYVLEDPSLDRAQFEAQMLDDPRLALAVADAVGQMQAWAEELASFDSQSPVLITAASESTELSAESTDALPGSVSHSEVSDSGVPGSLLPEAAASGFAISRFAARWLASAALVMLTLGVGLMGFRDWQRRAWQPSAEAAMSSRIVDSWLALEGVPAEDVDADEGVDVAGDAMWQDFALDDGIALSQNAATALESEHWASESTEEMVEDWLVEAAREFYSHQGSGFSGQGS
ncbi:MAG: hypothetical protein NXI32_12310 [bacterium]|nr:hypothetical protein [bacterium]